MSYARFLKSQHFKTHKPLTDVKVYSSTSTSPSSPTADYLEKSIRDLFDIAQFNLKHFSHFKKIKQTANTDHSLVMHEIELNNCTTFHIDNVVYHYAQPLIHVVSEPDEFVLTNEEKQTSISLNRKDFDFLITAEIIRRKHQLNLFQKPQKPQITTDSKELHVSMSLVCPADSESHEKTANLGFGGHG